MKKIFSLLWAASMLALSATAQAGEIRAAVAANFTGTLKRLGEVYQRQSGDTVILSAGSSGALYAQIANGAPFDVFFSADAERPEKLEQEGRIMPGSRFTYALGVLALWSADAAKVDSEGRVLSEGAFRHLAIAEPRNAPYGAAARQVMERMGVWQTLEARLVKGQSIGQTYSQIASGAAELGFVALPQIRTPDGMPGSSWIPPADMYTPIVQQAVLLVQAENPEGAKQFLEWVKGAEARAIIERDGYSLE